MVLPLLCDGGETNMPSSMMAGNLWHLSFLSMTMECRDPQLELRSESEDAGQTNPMVNKNFIIKLYLNIFTSPLVSPSPAVFLLFDAACECCHEDDHPKDRGQHDRHNQYTGD